MDFDLIKNNVGSFITCGNYRAQITVVDKFGSVPHYGFKVVGKHGIRGVERLDSFHPDAITGWIPAAFVRQPELSI